MLRRLGPLRLLAGARGPAARFRGAPGGVRLCAGLRHLTAVAAAPRLIVSNLKRDATEQDVLDAFGAVSSGVRRVHLPLDEEGRCLGTAFVDFVDAASATDARTKLRGARVRGRPVDLALEAGAIEAFESADGRGGAPADAQGAPPPQRGAVHNASLAAQLAELARAPAQGPRGEGANALQTLLDAVEEALRAGALASASPHGRFRNDPAVKARVEDGSSESASESAHEVWPFAALADVAQSMHQLPFHVVDIGRKQRMMRYVADAVALEHWSDGRLHSFSTDEAGFELESSTFTPGRVAGIVRGLAAARVYDQRVLGVLEAAVLRQSRTSAKRHIDAWSAADLAQVARAFDSANSKKTYEFSATGLFLFEAIADILMRSSEPVAPDDVSLFARAFAFRQRPTAAERSFRRHAPEAPRVRFRQTAKKVDVVEDADYRQVFLVLAKRALDVLPNLSAQATVDLALAFSTKVRRLRAKRRDAAEDHDAAINYDFVRRKYVPAHHFKLRTHRNEESTLSLPSTLPLHRRGDDDEFFERLETDFAPVFGAMAARIENLPGRQLQARQLAKVAFALSEVHRAFTDGDFDAGEDDGDDSGDALWAATLAKAAARDVVHFGTMLAPSLLAAPQQKRTDKLIPKGLLEQLASRLMVHDDFDHLNLDEVAKVAIAYSKARGRLKGRLTGRLTGRNAGPHAPDVLRRAGL